MANKNPVKVCAWCLKEPRFVKVEEKIKELGRRMHAEGRIKEFAEIFTHGVCARHTEQTMREDGSFNEDIIRRMVEKAKIDGSYDLAEHPELVNLYSQGIFTPEQIQAHQQQSQTELNELKARLRKLAGIIKS